MNARPVFRAFKAILLVAPLVALAQAPPPPGLTPLPPMPVPAGNPTTTAKANLGKVLFWDEQLSSSRTVACGTCHRAETGGMDPRAIKGDLLATNAGLDGVAGTADDITGSPGVQLANADGSLARSSAFGLGPQVTGRGTQSHINAGFAPANFWDGRATGTFVNPLNSADTPKDVGTSQQCRAEMCTMVNLEQAHARLTEP